MLANTLDRTVVATAAASYLQQPEFVLAQPLHTVRNMSIVIQPARAMPLLLGERARVAGGASSDRDGWLDTLAKLIPGEFIVAFAATTTLLGSGAAWGWHTAILFVLAAAVPLGLWSSARRRGSSAHLLQYAVRSAAFVMYALGCDDALWQPNGGPPWIPRLGSLVVPVLAAFVLCPPGAHSPPPRREPEKGDSRSDVAPHAPVRLLSINGCREHL